MKLAGVGNIFVSKSSYYGTRVRGWVLVTLWTTVIAAVICGAVYGITKAVRSAAAASCRHFAAISGYPSNFQIQHFLDGGTCYVRLPNGHSMPQKMIVGYLKADK
jgi:hypothetical protein